MFPISPPGSLQSAVPSWERRFCTSVCLIPWGRICAAKVSLSAYKNIAEWDDTAAFEAFQNAKARYWAYINNLPCNIPLPDPDMYISEVNHNDIIDPKLVEDLEKQQPPPLSDGKKDGRNGWDSFISENKQIPAPGWDNADGGSTCGHHSINWDKFVEQQRPSIGWSDPENHLNKHDGSSTGWNCRGSWPSWGEVPTREYSLTGGGNNNLWNDQRDPSWSQHWNNLNNEQGSRYNRKRNRGHHDSRFSKSRQTNNHQVNGSFWNGCMERNVQDYPYDKTMRGGQPMFMREPKSRRSCGPLNHQKSNDAGSAWHWGKSAT